MKDRASQLQRLQWQRPALSSINVMQSRIYAALLFGTAEPDCVAANDRSKSTYLRIPLVLRFPLPPLRLALSQPLLELLHPRREGHGRRRRRHRRCCLRVCCCLSRSVEMLVRARSALHPWAT